MTLLERSAACAADAEKYLLPVLRSEEAEK